MRLGEAQHHILMTMWIECSMRNPKSFAATVESTCAVPRLSPAILVLQILHLDHGVQGLVIKGGPVGNQACDREAHTPGGVTCWDPSAL